MTDIIWQCDCVYYRQNREQNVEVNDENQKKLVQNQLDKEENVMTELGTQLVDARNQLNVVSRDSKGDVNISDDVIRDLMNAKTDYRREELLKEEGEVLKKDKELQKQERSKK